MMKVSMTDSYDPSQMYINILDFKDKKEQEIIFRKVKDLIQQHETKTRVY